MIIYTLKPLDNDDLVALMERALADRERGLGILGVSVGKDVLEKIASLAGGDARQALTRLETAVSSVALGGGRELTILAAG